MRLKQRLVILIKVHLHVLSDYDGFQQLALSPKLSKTTVN